MIKDSGARRSFGTGAVRDVSVGKGRCDLLCLREVAELLDNRVIELLADYVETGEACYIYEAITLFYKDGKDTALTEMILDLSKHFEEGCIKYGEPKADTGYLSNWQLGIPLHCYIDSGVRHYLKHISGHTDERHDRSFIWNLLCAVWTQRNRPEMIDLPFAGKKVEPAPSEVREVKRPAKVGEWIKIVRTEDCEGEYQIGDACQVVEKCGSGCFAKTRGTHPCNRGPNTSYLTKREYVVLEGYDPDKEADHVA